MTASAWVAVWPGLGVQEHYRSAADALLNDPAPQLHCIDRQSGQVLRTISVDLVAVGDIIRSAPSHAACKRQLNQLVRDAITAAQG